MTKTMPNSMPKSQAISPLNEVATFGLFTALLVLANYIFVITFFPVVVLTYHRYFENKKWSRMPNTGVREYNTIKYTFFKSATIHFCFNH